MKVLLSIKPKFAKEIFSGHKKYEYRKVIFKRREIKTVVLYATMPVGKIVGEFEIDSILEETPLEIWNKTKDYSGITEDFFFSYYKGKDKSFAIKIKSFVQYRIPVCPYSLFPNFKAPQSFQYIG